MLRMLVTVLRTSRQLRRDCPLINRQPILSNCSCAPLLEPSLVRYSKGKDKKKEEKGKKKVHINEQSLAEVVNIEKIKLEMMSNIEKMNELFVKHLSVRSSIGSIEQLLVVLEGKKYPLIELGQVMRNNPKMIVINLSSFPLAIRPVLKALEESGMNLNPQQDGTTLFVPIPKVTKEHRESLAKNAKALYVRCRDSIRDVQNSCTRTVKNKEKQGLSTDISRQVQDQVKSIADYYIGEADKLLNSKQAELMKG